jgi:hypothetical protein
MQVCHFFKDDIFFVHRVLGPEVVVAKTPMIEMCG